LNPRPLNVSLGRVEPRRLFFTDRPAATPNPVYDPNPVHET